MTGWAQAAGRLSSGRLRVELAAHGGVSLSNGRFCLGSLAGQRRHHPWRVACSRIDTEERRVLESMIVAVMTFLMLKSTNPTLATERAVRVLEL